MTISCEPCCYVAFPVSKVVGDVLLYDATNLSSHRVIHAHKERLQKSTFSKTQLQLGQSRSIKKCYLLATASKKGTIIRIFAVPSGEKLYAFRRGTLGASIFSIAFDNENSLMVNIFQSLNL